MTAAESQPAEPKPRRRWHQYRLRTLLLAVTVAGVLLAGWKVYQKLTVQPLFVFFDIWQTALHNGDGIGRVQGLLGRGRELKDASSVIGHIRSNPGLYPAGLEEGDKFFLYEMPYGRTTKAQVSLQFRHGVLVNHNPTSIPLVRFLDESGQDYRLTSSRAGGARTRAGQRAAAAPWTPRW